MKAERRTIFRLALALLICLLLLPFVLFGLSNLFLMSPAGRAFLGRSITSRIKLDASVRGASFSPWNGFTIYGLKIEQPGELPPSARPLLLLEELRALPAWKPLLRNRLELREIEITRPILHLPIELLSAISSRKPPPEIASSKTPPATPPAATIPNPPDPIPAPIPQVAAFPPTVPPRPSVPGIRLDPPLVIPPAPDSEIPDPAPVFAQIHHGSLFVSSAKSERTFLNIGDISGSIPLSGAPAGRSLKLSQISLPGRAPLPPLEIPVGWRNPTLSFGPVGRGISGIETILLARVFLLPGIPFSVEAVVPEQHTRVIAVPPHGSAKIGNIGGRSILQGYAGNPAGWRGQGILKVSSVTAILPQATTQFDSGQLLAYFGNGILAFPDARLIGDEISILGNAALLPDGRAAARIRLVAAPEKLIGIHPQFFQRSSPPRLTRLSTPQRSAWDIGIFWTPEKLLIFPDPWADPIPLR